MRNATTAMALAGVLAIHCVDRSTGPSGSRGDAGAEACLAVSVDQREMIRGSGDTLYFVRARRSDTTRSCVGGSLVVTPTIVASDTDTVLYRLSGDTLKLSLETDNPGYTLLPAITVFTVHTRLSGTGLAGSWRPIALSYEDPAGALNMIERAIIDSILVAVSQAYADSLETTTVISANSIAVTNPWHAAEDFLEAWSADSSAYDIEAEKRDECRLALTGRVSGETVTVTGTGQGEVVFTSTDPSHGTHTYSPVNPRSCPNQDRPGWWEEFLEANRK